MWWNATDVIVCLLVLKFIGNTMVLLWACSLLAQLLVHTSGSSCHTPAADVRVVGYLLPHECLLQGHLCSSTHLVSDAP